MSLWRVKLFPDSTPDIFFYVTLRWDRRCAANWQPLPRYGVSRIDRIGGDSGLIFKPFYFQLLAPCLSIRIAAVDKKSSLFLLTMAPLGRRIDFRKRGSDSKRVF
jgi:hypothetical protein